MRLATLLFAVIAAFIAAPAARSDGNLLHIVSPYAAGGIGDALIRAMAEHIRTSLNRPIIIENKPGAAGRLGVQYVKDAAADGSVLLFTPIAPMSIFPLVYDKPGYDAVADFQPVSQIATFDFGIAVGPSMPVKSLNELVAWLAANPARASFGTPAAGSLPHFVAVLFARSAGLELHHVPYKGNPRALADLMGGHLPMLFTSSQDLAEGHKSGRLRVLATSGTARSTMLPDVPTFRESGFAIEGEGWFGVYVPAKTPAAVIVKLNQTIVNAARTPEVVALMKTLGVHPTGTTAAELARIQRADMEFWRPIIAASGFKPEQ